MCFVISVFSVYICDCCCRSSLLRCSCQSFINWRRCVVGRLYFLHLHNQMICNILIFNKQISDKLVIIVCPLARWITTQRQGGDQWRRRMMVMVPVIIIAERMGGRKKSALLSHTTHTREIICDNNLSRQRILILITALLCWGLAKAQTQTHPEDDQ